MSIGETNGPIHVVLRWDVILLIYSLGQTSNSLLQPFENLVKLLMIHFGSGQKIEIGHPKEGLQSSCHIENDSAGRKLKEGHSLRVGQALLLSGGEQQRLAMARVLLRRSVKSMPYSGFFSRMG